MNQTLWTATAAFVIGGAVRAIKAGAFPVNIPKRALPWLALVLGAVSAALDARLNGVGWETAVATGVTATVRLAPVPPKTILASGARTGFEELPLTVRLLAAVSTSATVNAIGPVEVS